ncbi:hypothetical protein PROFUN_10452 [Planoprotostelium fungivorum]|uniref:Uncharacterized protein n=1 Tax=Planoprotostelium fungivorum TaxID=1890364 RepID=A0A2P6NE20_9EUKA|nr:hypothetical protein PROFUN_10452 [Planoprotostelium fungivorum]
MEHLTTVAWSAATTTLTSPHYSIDSHPLLGVPRDAQEIMVERLLPHDAKQIEQDLRRPPEIWLGQDIPTPTIMDKPRSASATKLSMQLKKLHELTDNISKVPPLVTFNSDTLMEEQASSCYKAVYRTSLAGYEHTLRRFTLNVSTSKTKLSTSTPILDRVRMKSPRRNESSLRRSSSGGSKDSMTEDE